MYEEAIAAYLTAQNRYPASGLAEEAGFKAALCYYRLTLENPNDEQLLENAWAALSVFLTRYPASEKAPEADSRRKELFNRRAALAYRRACFYDRIARRPEAALVAYRTFIHSSLPPNGRTKPGDALRCSRKKWRVPHDR